MRIIKKDKKLDVVICLGKTPNEDGNLGENLKERVKLAYKIANKSNVPLILSGGKSHKILEKRPISEATAMHKYLKTNYDIKNMEIILEEKGESTIQQLCIIKNDILLPSRWFKVSLVTDKVHLKRAKNTAEWIFGKKFVVYGFGSKPNIVEEKIDSYLNREKEKLKLSKSNFTKNFRRGDDKSILEYSKIYRKLKREHIRKGGDPSKVLKIPGYY